MQNFGQIMPREREVVFRFINVIARSKATRQSIVPHKERMDCFAGARNDVEKGGANAITFLPPVKPGDDSFPPGEGK